VRIPQPGQNQLDSFEPAANAEAEHTAKAARTSVKKKRGGALTAAGRKRLSETMKKRWAEGRKKSTWHLLASGDF
jgi:hypothetical protein